MIVRWDLLVEDINQAVIKSNICPLEEESDIEGYDDFDLEQILKLNQISLKQASVLNNADIAPIIN